MLKVCIVTCLVFFCTAVVPVHVDAPIGPAAEQVFIAELNRARDVIDEVKQMPAVSELIKRLRDPNEEVKADVEDQLITKFKDVLYQHGFQQSFRSSVAPFLAHITVSYISVLTAKQGDSIIVYFLCESLQSLDHLRQMIASHYIHEVFVAIIEAVPHTYVGVYVRVKDEDLNVALQCLAGLQDTGL